MAISGKWHGCHFKKRKGCVSAPNNSTQNFRKCMFLGSFQIFIICFLQKENPDQILSFILSTYFLYALHPLNFKQDSKKKMQMLFNLPCVNDGCCNSSHLSVRLNSNEHTIISREKKLDRQFDSSQKCRSSSSVSPQTSLANFLEFYILLGRYKRLAIFLIGN